MKRISLILFFFITVLNLIRVNADLVCPTLPPSTIGICIEGCFTDNDCKNGTKCCSNGCGHVCTTPVQSQALVGTCPKYSFWWNIICWFNRKPSECNSDSDCTKTGQKCCMDPCKRTCVDQCYDSTNCECDTSKYPMLLSSGALGVQCSKCTCIDLCQNYCKPGYNCVLQEVQCIRAPCYKVPKCVPVPACSTIMCMIYCPYGFTNNSNGCPICNCFNPCSNVVCSPGTVCTVSKTNSTSSPYVGSCTAPTSVTPATPVTSICANVICAMYCPYGYVNDSNGCQTCKCFDPCANVVCYTGMVCTVLQTICVSNASNCPSLYYGICIPATPAPPVTPIACSNILCTLYCPYGFMNDSNGCPICKCFTPATTVIPISCSNVICTLPCQYGFMYDKYGCQMCNCLTPCATLLCPIGKVCNVSKSNCTTYSSACQPYIGTCV